MLLTYEISPDITEEFTAGVRWLQTNGRPDLTVPLALREAVEDWISALRAERLRGYEIPRGPGRPPLHTVPSQSRPPPRAADPETAPNASDPDP
jgi:hypothetical protein